MLFKNVRDTYRRFVVSPSDDPLFFDLSSSDRESRHKRNRRILHLLEYAKPFLVDDDAYILANTLDMEIKSGKDLGPMMLEAPFPFKFNWIEYDDAARNDAHELQRYRVGVMIRRGEADVFACCFFKAEGQAFVEPLILISVKETGEISMTMDPYTSPKLIETFDGSDDERLGEASHVAMSQAGLAISTVLGVLHLIATRQGPLDRVEEPLLSRPERRRLERKGTLPKGPPPTLTRIRVNEQGRLHLAAVDDEEGGAGGARRRAHRVRGHFMRKAAGGKSWRKPHVRGFGPLHDTTRLIGIASDTENSES